MTLEKLEPKNVKQFSNCSQPALLLATRADKHFRSIKKEKRCEKLGKTEGKQRKTYFRKGKLCFEKKRNVENQRKIEEKLRKLAVCASYHIHVATCSTQQMNL